MKQCIVCRKKREDNEYRIWRGRINKICNVCRDKNNEWYKNDIDGKRTKAKERYIKNREKISIYRVEKRLKKKYSLSKEDWTIMLNNQNNKCLICEKSFIDMKPCVDHNHKTNKIRALLCRRCNLDLQVVENKEFLQKALKYLQVYDV